MTVGITELPPEGMQLGGVALAGDAERGTRTTEGLSLLFTAAGITVQGPQPQIERLLIWSGLDSATCGEQVVLPDGQHAAVMELTSGGQSIRFLLPSASVSPGQAAYLDQALPAWLDRYKAQAPAPGGPSAPVPDPGPTAAMPVEDPVPAGEVAPDAPSTAAAPPLPPLASPGAEPAPAPATREPAPPILVARGNAVVGRAATGGVVTNGTNGAATNGAHAADPSATQLPPPPPGPPAVGLDVPPPPPPPGAPLGLDGPPTAEPSPPAKTKTRGRRRAKREAEEAAAVAVGAGSPDAAPAAPPADPVPLQLPLPPPPPEAHAPAPAKRTRRRRKADPAAPATTPAAAGVAGVAMTDLLAGSPPPPPGVTGLDAPPAGAPVASPPAPGTAPAPTGGSPATEGPWGTLAGDDAASTAPGSGGAGRSRTGLAVLLAVLLVVVLGGIAYVLVKRHSPSTTPTTAAVVPPTTPAATDQALAASVNLRLGDLPAGWLAGTSGPAQPPTVPTSVSSVADTALASCLAVPETTVASLFQWTAAEGQTASVGSLLYHDGAAPGIQMRSQARTLATTADTATLSQAFTSPNFASCYGQFQSALYGGAVAGATATAQPVALAAPVGVKAYGYVTTISLPGGTSQELGQAFVFGGRVEAELQPTTDGPPIPTTAFQPAFQAISGRVSLAATK